MSEHYTTYPEDHPARDLKMSVLLLFVLLAIAAGCMFVADRVQHDNGRVNIEDGVISTGDGDIAYKLYIPASASTERPAPGVLLLHGYQNDHETNAAYAIELARRGYVALSIDCYGHGATTIGLAKRGYVNHVVRVNYGNDSEEDGTYAQISGPIRYRILMNFSNLSFFDKHYTTDDAGNTIEDSSCGGIAAYTYLASLPYVDDTRLGLTGHSMGTWSSWSVAAAFSGATNEAGEDISPKAIVLQCGELFRELPSVYDTNKIHFNNVLLLQAKYDEFSYFRDYQYNVDDSLLETPLRREFLGLERADTASVVADAEGSADAAATADGASATDAAATTGVTAVTGTQTTTDATNPNTAAPSASTTDSTAAAAPLTTSISTGRAEWNKTYGAFADGSARRMELLITNHRLTTHNVKGLATALEWFASGLGQTSSMEPGNQVALIKEWLVLAAMMATLFAMFPLMDLLLAIPIFRAAQPGLPERSTMKGVGGWLLAALITIVCSAGTYPFMTQLGHGLLPLPEDIFKMTVGNGFVGWYLTLILIMVITTFIGIHGAHSDGEPYNWHAAGLTSGAGAGKTILMVIESAILAVLMTGLVYGMNYAFCYFFDLDLRFIWPFFRPLNVERAKQFGIYLPIFALFYLLNNSKIMAGQRTGASYHEGIGWALIDWFKNFVLMAGGILAVVALEYVPFFMGIGPGADVYLGGTFGGPFMSILILFVPQVLFFSISCTYCYRRTGNVWTGALVAALLACWIVTGGSAFL